MHMMKSKTNNIVQQKEQNQPQQQQQSLHNKMTSQSRLQELCGGAGKKKKTKNKSIGGGGAPIETSSKSRVSVLRKTIEDKSLHKPKTRDPRFDDLSGELKIDAHQRAYQFLDDIRVKEKDAIKNEMKNTKDIDRKLELRLLLDRIVSKEQQSAKKRRQKDIIAEHRRKELKLAETVGKTPYFLKKADVKRAELVERFKTMDSKTVSKTIERKRKRVAGREHTSMPHMRRSAAEYDQ